MPTGDKQPQYVQCELIQPDHPRGQRRQVAFIPAQFAVQGAVLKIRVVKPEQKIDEWEDGWVVNAVYASSQTIQPSMIRRGQRRFEKRLK